MENIDIDKLKLLGVLVGSEIDSNLSEKICGGYLIGGSIPVAALTIRRYRGEDNNIYVLTDTFFKMSAETTTRHNICLLTTSTEKED